MILFLLYIKFEYLFCRDEPSGDICIEPFYDGWYIRRGRDSHVAVDTALRHRLTYGYHAVGVISHGGIFGESQCAG